MKPLISVIIPVYNAAKYLKQCLDSVVAQSLSQIEIILVDDGSTDNSLSILESYAKKDSRIKVLKQKNSGPGLARNKGIALAQGDFISFMDADDFFEKDLLESLYRKAQATNSDIVFCRFWMYNQSTLRDEPPEYDVSMDLLPESKVFSAETYPEHILNLYITAVWSSLYRKDFILENKIRFSMATRVEDNLFAQLAIVFAKRISFLNRKLIHYRRFFNTSLTDNVDKFWKNSFIVHQEIRDFLVKNGKYETLKRTFMKHFLNHIRYHVIERCHEPFKSLAIEYARNCLEQDFHLTLYDIKHYVSEETENFYKNIFTRYGNISLLEQFFSEKKQKIVPVVYATNEVFVPVLSVSLASLKAHAQADNFYDIYILHTGLSENSICRLERMSEHNVRVLCVNISKLLNNKKKLYDQDHYSAEMFYRFYAPQVLAAYDKILYLDADTIVQRDLADLYATNIGKMPVAGCVQPLRNKFKKYCIRKLKLKPETYINSGILLFNTKQWNALKLTDETMKNIRRAGAYKAPDQDILNMVCRNSIFYLDGRWNCIANIGERHISDYKAEEYRMAVKMLDNPFILHYTSNKKPWGFFDYFEGCIWWDYAKQSVFYEYFRKIRERLLYHRS